MNLKIVSLAKLAKDNGLSFVEVFYSADAMSLLENPEKKDIELTFSDGKTMLGKILLNEDNRDDQATVVSASTDFQRKNCFSVGTQESEFESKIKALHIQLKNAEEYNLGFNYITVNFRPFDFTNFGWAGKAIIIFNLYD